jgi:hypothetical protein
MQTDRAYWFEFDPANGDLVDTDVPEHSDGPASLALSLDAGDWLADHSENEIFRRYGARLRR